MDIIFIALERRD